MVRFGGDPIIVRPRCGACWWFGRRLLEERFKLGFALRLGWRGASAQNHLLVKQPPPVRFGAARGFIANDQRPRKVVHRFAVELMQL